jgi:hypothetical protein
VHRIIHCDWRDTKCQHYLVAVTQPGTDSRCLAKYSSRLQFQFSVIIHQIHSTGKSDNLFQNFCQKGNWCRFTGKVKISKQSVNMVPAVVLTAVVETAMMVVVVVKYTALHPYYSNIWEYLRSYIYRYGCGGILI